MGVINTTAPDSSDGTDDGELVEYPACHEAILHVLETNDCLEANQAYTANDVQVLDQQVL